jgi:threonine synthase
VVEDSSGNAGCAIAAYCAKAGIACDIYVPADTSPAKLAQIEIYNAMLHKIPGSREDTATAVLAAAQKHYYASHSWNPFFFQGTKTFAYEICEQLNWQAPDYVILPVGNGTLLLGASIGFNELKKAGVIQQLPRLIGVQSDGCAPLVKAFAERVYPAPWIDKKDTLAEGIAIAHPVRGEQILSAVRESEGKFVSVSDDEIGRMVVWAGRQGFYIEPTAGAAIAGMVKMINEIPENKTIVSVFTGHGLKAGEKILKLLH